MPARELGSSYPSADGAHRMGTTLLKRHKILPHPQEDQFVDFAPSTPANKARDLVIDTGVTSSSDSSSPRILKHSKQRIGAPDLPPTPPAHSRHSSGTNISILPASASGSNSISNLVDPRSVPSTPPNAKSPPTPDFTPPRNPPLAFRPLIRVPSSRNDSFKTAREDPFSSDEEEGTSTIRSFLQSARASAVEVPKIQPSGQRRKEIGLGLGGLGLSNSEETVTPHLSHVDRSQEAFVIFDGEWGSTKEDPSQVTKEWDSNLMRNVTVRKRPARHSFPSPIDGASDDVLEDNLVRPTAATKVVRSLPLQERIARHRMAKNMSEKALVEDDLISTPRAVREPPSTPIVRRVCTMPGSAKTSAVIEAVVVDARPSRQKTLRHTKKQIGLRDFGSDQSTLSSAQASVVSVEHQRHPHQHAAQATDRKHRSAVSHTTMTSTSSSGRSRKEIVKNGGVPVVVIPVRRSSIKSSHAPSLRSSSSRKTKRSMSLNSAPLSSSSKCNDTGYFDSAHTRGRAMSASAGSNSIRTIDFPPNIPARRSSLSAPTSRAASQAGSRTVSLTAESLNAHNMIEAKNQEKAEPKLHVSPAAQMEPREPDTPGQPSRMNVDHNGDPFFGKRLSTQVTPFSQVSYDTAGTTAEVAEAFAVSLHPHQNRSVLVVQHEPSPASIKAADMAENVQTAVKPRLKPNPKIVMGPSTPPQPTHPMDAVDSPLRNPRAPPEPPAIQFIPPTPAGDEEDRELGERPSTSDDAPQKRSMSLIRRFSTRRSSEPAAGPGFLRRALSLSRNTRQRADGSTQTSKGEANPTPIYPTVSDKPADGTKLHPFWRPANFWDDLEDDGFVDGWPEIDNRPSPPKRSLSNKFKRSIGIEDSEELDRWRPVDRRTMVKTPGGNLRVSKQRSSSSLRLARYKVEDSNNRRPHTGGGEREWGANFREGNGGSRVHVIPGLGLSIQYIGWDGMKRRLSERRRERLRGRISGPKALRGGVDDVLRRRSGSRSVNPTRAL